MNALKQTFARVAQSRAAKGAAVVASIGAASIPAHAALDVSAVTTEISGAVATVTSLGISVLSLVVVVKLFTWVRGAIK